LFKGTGKQKRPYLFLKLLMHALKNISFPKKWKTPPKKFF
jgi:hypothetical protein